MVPVVAFASVGSLVSVSAARVMLKGHDRTNQPSCVGAEMPGGQVCEGGVLQVGVDLFDDRVAAVDSIGGHGVEDAGVGGG